MKHALTKAHVLISPDFSKNFLVFSFSSKHTIARVLLQKNSHDMEQSIAFFSRVLRDSKLKYNVIEKQEYAMVKTLKDFRVYILHSHVISYVPSTVVEDILTQPDLDGKSGRWIASLLEYDLEIKPTKLVKAQGLAQLMTQENLDVLGINYPSGFSRQIDDSTSNLQVLPNFSSSHWYKDII